MALADKLGLLGPLACAALLSTTPAYADVSSWLFVGTGPAWVGSNGLGRERLALEFETGLGTPPDQPFVFGGLLSTQTFFASGTDVALALRGATGGFVNGDFGVAMDLGGYQRWWGLGSTGLSGALVLGAPWGITLNLGGGFGTNNQRHLGVLVGIDFARLTVYRKTGESWWKNPFPAVREDEPPF